MDVWCNTHFFHVKIWNHQFETTILQWMLTVFPPAKRNKNPTFPSSQWQPPNCWTSWFRRFAEPNFPGFLVWNLFEPWIILIIFLGDPDFMAAYEIICIQLKRKKPSYFPLNPSWLIGILIIGDYNPYITAWIVKSPEKKNLSHEMLTDKNVPHSQPWLKLLPPALHRKFQVADQPTSRIIPGRT